MCLSRYDQDAIIFSFASGVVARTPYLQRHAKRDCVEWSGRGSVAIYGPDRDYPPAPISEPRCTVRPNLYGASKSLCETMARQMAETNGLDIVGLRLSVVYGTGWRGYMTYPLAVIRDAATSNSVIVRFGDKCTTGLVPAVSMTSAVPERAASRATARPTPWVAPVTNRILPSIRKSKACAPNRTTPVEQSKPTAAARDRPQSRARPARLSRRA